MLVEAMPMFRGRSRRARPSPMVGLWAALLLLPVLCVALFFMGAEVRAQPAGLNVGRDCQVIRTCNFSRRGPYRGCLSSYSCRICRFVRTACAIDGSRRLCQQMRCTWG